MMWRYRELLPPKDERSIVSLGEQMTPVLRCRRLGERFGLDNLFIKDESRLPTGSFKSRGMAVAVSMAYDRRIAIIFIFSEAAVFVLLRLIAEAVMDLARRAPSLSWPMLRLAVANIHRPGALTAMPSWTRGALSIAGFFGLMAVGHAFPAFAGVIDLALPFFGLIGLGFICGRMFDFGEEGLAWVNVYIVYAALPSLMFTLVSKTPVAELLNLRFVACTVGATITAFSIAFLVGMKATRNAQEAAIQGLVGGYANIGYMGPGLTLAALGAGSAAPTALIFVADTIFLFSAVPLLMAAGRQDGESVARTIGRALVRAFTNPFNLSVFVAVAAAYFSWQPPAPIARMTVLLSGSAAPAALFALGVTVALRPMRRVAPELPVLLAIKLIGHPLVVRLYAAQAFAKLIDLPVLGALPATAADHPQPHAKEHPGPALHLSREGRPPRRRVPISGAGFSGRGTSAVDRRAVA